MSSPEFRQGPVKEKREGVVNKEVNNLLKQGKKEISKTDLIELSKKYDEDVVDKIQDKFVETLKNIRKKAKKFATLIHQKMGDRNYPLHKLLRQARKFKAKYNLSDEEFEEFRRIYERQLSGIHENVGVKTHTYPRTAIGKTLGHEAYGETMKVSAEDYEHLQKILALHAATKSLHTQLTLQSLTYKDVSPEAVLGEFSVQKHNPHQAIHSVLFGMFVPKFKLFDEHILLANIGNIIAKKHKGEPINNKPDYQLYYDLISDVNDVVCDTHSPVKDLLRRYELQYSIWNNVLNLRSGRYYGDWASEFLMAIDNCKIAQYDVPDLLYAGDVGTVMQRILAAFSIRPTIVQSVPLVMFHGLNMNQDLLSQAPKIRSIPYIRVVMPYSTANNNPVHLNDALDQPQYIADEEHKRVIPMKQSIIYSRDVLVFYVSRRVNSINISPHTSPYNFNRLPFSIAGVEKVNTRPVNFDHNIRVGDEDFVLRSVVCVDTHEALGEVAIGSSTLITKRRNISALSSDVEYYYYNPRRGGEVYYEGSDNKRLPPVTSVKKDVGDYDQTLSFDNHASKYGTVFIYENVSSFPSDLLQSDVKTLQFNY